MGRKSTNSLINNYSLGNGYLHDLLFYLG